jgi:DNA (cytosine-5)-methyltransferase 1
MISPQLGLSLHDEIFIDNFAGGGGASTGIERAIRRSVDEALNHDRKALAMHRMNHPTTRHHCENIMNADPLKIAGQRRVGGIWFSPDCKHFSKAKGGKPRNKKIRGLAWSVMHWVNVLGRRPAGKPRVIYLENVEEFQTWCPLLPDGIPNTWRKGWFFRCFIGALRRRGYVVEWRELRACDYGAPTIRKRLFLIARCDGLPIVWPEVTHAAPANVVKGVKPYRTMAECIDFSLPCPSIFLTREQARAVRCIRPLASSTMARVAKGVDRYVLKAKRPFIVNTRNGEREGQSPRVRDINQPGWTVTAEGSQHGLVVPVVAHAQHGGGARPADAPLHTVTASAKDQNQLIAGTLAHIAHGETDKNGKKRGRGARDVREPAPTVLASNDLGAVACHLTKFNTGATGAALDEPGPTITANSFVKRPGGAAPLGFVAAGMVKLSGSPDDHAPGHAVEEPGHTIRAGGQHHGVIAAYVAQHNGGANGHQTIGHPVDAPASTISSKGSQQQLVGCTAIPYYGSEEDGCGVEEPARTVTTRDRFGIAPCIGAPHPISPEQEAGARRVAAFLREHGVQFDGEFASLTMRGEVYVIVDIGMRMLKPRELYLAQGFPGGYIIDRGLDEDATGRAFEIILTGTEQVRMVGNSVSPPMAEALVAANNPEMRVEEMAA